MDKNDDTPNGTSASEKGYSKEKAALYLSISVRSLEYKMEEKLVKYEKHGRKVVFRRWHLEEYRSNCERSTANPRREGMAGSNSAGSDDETLDPSLRSILAVDARDFLKEVTCEATTTRKLTRESARKILTTLGGQSEPKAEELLGEYAVASVQAFEQLRIGSPKRALARMDWSYAVATCFLDFMGRMDYWGRDEDAYIPLKSPFDPTPVYPCRMLPCLRFIPEAEFATVIGEVAEFFAQPLKVERKAFEARLTSGDLATTASRSTNPNDLGGARERLWEQHCSDKYFVTGKVTQYANDLVPLDVALRRLPESANKKPFSFVGPIDAEAVRTVMVRYFSPRETADAILGQALSLSMIAKLRWLRHQPAMATLDR